MIRRGCSPRFLASVFAVVVAAAVFAPPRVWAASGDDPDEGSGLTVMADFNRDGIADIAKATLPDEDQPGAGVLTVSLGRADGTFEQIASKAVLGHAPRSIVTGDFNNDGIPDVIVGDDDGSIKLFTGDGAGNLVPAGEIARLGSVVSIAVADFNHDGVPDMAVTDWKRSAMTVFLGTGQGSFQQEWSFPLRMPGTVPHIAAADFNGDGIPDLAVVYGDEGEYTFDVMLGNGKGAFMHAPQLSSVKDPNSHCPT